MPPDVPPADDPRRDDAPAAADDARAPSRPNGLRRVLLTLGGLVGLVVVLLLVAVGLLQTRAGARFALDQVIKLANPYEDATLTVGEVRGTWVTGLRLYDLRLTRKDGTPMAIIDTLEARYALLPILRNRLHIRSGYLAGAYLNFRQGPDRVFDVQLPFLPDTLEVADDTLKGKGLQLQLDRIDVRRTSADFEFYNPARDSVYGLQNLNLWLRDLRVTDQVAFNVDSIHTRYSLPTGMGTGLVRAGVKLDGNLLDVSSFRLASTRSDVTARGKLRLPADSTERLSDAGFYLRAAPLSLADVAVYVPALNTDAEVWADVAVTGDLDLLRVNANGRTGDGGTFGLVGALRPPGDGAVRYDLTARLRGLDPGYFTTPTGTRLTADARADLAGPSLDRISGPVQVSLPGLTFGDFQVGQTNLDGRFDEGEAALTLASAVNGASVRVAGRVWPFDEVLRYNLTGRFADVNLARFTEGGQASDLGGTLRVSGAGTSPDSARVDARLDLDPSVLGAYRIQDATLSAFLEDGDLRFGTRVVLPQGRLQAAGDASFGETIRYRITDGRLENFDVAAFTGNPQFSRVNATFRVDGVGTDPNTLRANADLRLGPTAYDRYRLAGATARVRLDRGRLNATLDANTNVGRFDLVASGAPFRDPQRVRLDRLDFRDVDLGEITGDPAQSSNLNGSLTATVNGFDPATMALDATLTLAPSRLNAQTIESARLDADLRRGGLTYRLALDVPEGQARLAGGARPFDAVPTYRIDEGTFGGVNVGAFTGNDALTTNLNGRLTLAGRGFDPKTLTLDAALRLDSSLVNETVIAGGDLTAALADGLADARLTLDADAGRAEVTATGRFLDEVPTYRVNGLFADVDVARFLGNDTLLAGGSLRFDVDGAGFDPQTMRLAGSITADSARYEDVVLDTLGARFAYAEGALDLDSLLLRSNVLDADAGGTVAVFDTVRTTSDLRVKAFLRDLRPVRPLLNADVLGAEKGELAARLYGRPGRLRYEADLDLFSLIYNEIRVAGAELRSAGDFDPGFALRRAELTGRVDYFAWGERNLQKSTFRADYDTNTVAFTSVIDADDRRAARFGGRVDLRPEIQRVDFDSLNLRFDRDQWRLARPAFVTYGDRYRVSNFLLTSGDQQVAVDGAIDPYGDQSLVMTIDGFRVGAIADLFGFKGLDGALTGSVDLSGPAAAPRLDGALDLSVVSFDEHVGDVALALRYDSLRLGTDAVFTHVDGSDLTIRGYVPMALNFAPATDSTGAPTGGVALAADDAPAEGEVSFTVVADSFAIGWVRPFLDPATVDRLDGRLVSDIRVGGQLSAPVLSGEARLVRGTVGLPELGVRYQDIAVEVSLANNDVTLDRLYAESGGGSVTGTGTVALPDLTLGQFNLDLELDDFRPINNDIRIRQVSGPLRVRGTTDAPRIEGDLRVDEAEIVLTETNSFEDVPLTREDVLNVETRFGIRVGADTTVSQTFQALALDLRVALERDTWLRSRITPAMDIQFTGALDLRKAAGGELNLFGDIEVVPERSSLTALGRRFDLSAGTAQFNGPLTELLLDVAARYSPRRATSREAAATITLAARGRPLVENDLEITFASDPPMETADILSYIATGRPASQALAFSGSGGGGGGGLVETGAGLALSQLAGVLEGVAGRELGLDVIEIEQEGIQGTRLTAGKYLSPRVFASISYPLSYGTSTPGQRPTTGQAATITLEYEVTNWLLLSLMAQSDVISSSLRWEYAY